MYTPQTVTGVVISSIFPQAKSSLGAKLWMFGFISSCHLYCVVRSSFEINS